jgi:Cdc6-like AAA superfamily ATPase
MPIETWLPSGHKLPGGFITRMAIYGGQDWQIIRIQGGGCALVAAPGLTRRWVESGLLSQEQLVPFTFGNLQLNCLVCEADHAMFAVDSSPLPRNKGEALSFALALKASREVDAQSAFQDAIFVEKITRLLPTYGISTKVEDDEVLGTWLSGGAPVSVRSFRRLQQTVGWLPLDHLSDVVRAAGYEIPELVKGGPAQLALVDASSSEPNKGQGAARSTKFDLAGRPELASFFNEHVVDIIQNAARYKALGIDFPSAVILHGPPGCGKTFAVERLVDFLGWPSYAIDASSVASPYIHETSKKVAQVFEQAIQNAPSVLVIDEMEAFLADREMGNGHHRVEEVAEFLRRIPEAIKSHVLIIAMTNRIDMIDAAILRRGRFDHVVKVDLASEQEVLGLLEKLLQDLPKDESVDPRPFAKKLAGRPLSDVSFVIREGARLAARAGKDVLDQESLQLAMDASPARRSDAGEKKNPIGFL